MKELKKWIVMIAVLFVLTGMMSCELFDGGDDPTVFGSWEDGYGSEMIITEDSFSSYYNGTLSYSAEVISYHNNEWNQSENGEGSYGYLVIQYENTPYWYDADSLTGKYMVLRWQNLAYNLGVTTMEYSEGSNDSDWTDTTPGTLFDTEEEAIAGATGADGFFYFSSVTSEN